jgi:hypothetical protein
VKHVVLIDYIQSEKGHDTFMVSRKITRTYYVLNGSGYFTIDQKRYPVEPGLVVEVPPKVEYSYSGKITLLGISIPGWSSGNNTFTRWNPDVVGCDLPCAVDSLSWCTQFVRMRIFGKWPVGAYLGLNQRLWNKAPASILRGSVMTTYGKFLHRLACV